MSTIYHKNNPRHERLVKAQKYADAVSSIEDKIVDILPNLIDKLIVLAMGAKVERRGHDGQIYTVELPPDRKAIVYLCDRVLGKPARQWVPPTDPEKPLEPVIKNGANVRDPIAIHPREYEPATAAAPSPGASLAELCKNDPEINALLAMLARPFSQQPGADRARHEAAAKLTHVIDRRFVNVNS